MTEDRTTIDDLRDGEDHGEDAADMDVVFNEFEHILSAVKRAAFAIRSRRNEAEAIDALRDAVARTTDLQSAVLDYMSSVEDDEDDEEGGEEEEEEDDEPEAVDPLRAGTDSTE